MNPHLYIITLAIDNLEKLLAFYRDGFSYSRH
jgi:hypothetical protein